MMAGSPQLEVTGVVVGAVIDARRRYPVDGHVGVVGVAGLGVLIILIVGGKGRRGLLRGGQKWKDDHERQGQGAEERKSNRI
jgi:hypothetical protein